MNKSNNSQNAREFDAEIYRALQAAGWTFPETPAEVEHMEQELAENPVSITDDLRKLLSPKERWLVPTKFRYLKHRTIKSMAWMIKCMKWKYRQEKNIPDDVDDCNVEYSPELQEAINVLKELCE